MSDDHLQQPNSPTRVLVVDDNADAARMLGQLIKYYGGEIRTAGNGQAAIQIAELFRPNLILMDIRMPIINGCEATTLIREQTWGIGMRIIAMTGLSDGHSEILNSGFDGIVVKPIAPDQIQCLIR